MPDSHQNPSSRPPDGADDLPSEPEPDPRAAREIEAAADDETETPSEEPEPGNRSATAIGALTARRTVTAFLAHRMTDSAAALTYYAVLSIFPGLLALVSVFGLFGQSAQPFIDRSLALVPEPMRDTLAGIISDLQASPGTASVMVVVGILAALWTASGYVAAFTRVMNVVYDVPEGRPLWLTLPLRLIITVLATVIAVVGLAIVVLTGKFARAVGAELGVGGTAVTVWGIAKWPVLVLLMALVVTVLYWACPNAKVGGPLRLAPGALLAITAWLAASAGFAVYVANFASYNRTYGALGGVIVFLVWLWISNLAILFGAEFNAQRHRARAAREAAGGHFATPRDTRKTPPRVPTWTGDDVERHD